MARRRSSDARSGSSVGQWSCGCADHTKGQDRFWETPEFQKTLAWEDETAQRLIAGLRQRKPPSPALYAYPPTLGNERVLDAQRHFARLRVRLHNRESYLEQV